MEWRTLFQESTREFKIKTGPLSSRIRPVFSSSCCNVFKNGYGFTVGKCRNEKPPPPACLGRSRWLPIVSSNWAAAGPCRHAGLDTRRKWVLQPSWDPRWAPSPRRRTSAFGLRFFAENWKGLTAWFQLNHDWTTQFCIKKWWLKPPLNGRNTWLGHKAQRIDGMETWWLMETFWLWWCWASKPSEQQPLGIFRSDLVWECSQWQ